MAKAERRHEGERPDQQMQQRERLFHAALSVALERGFGHVTMDAVARCAGVSKGGLLYHFPSKTHLIRALLARYAGEASGDAAQPLPAGHGACGGIDPQAVAVLIAAAEKPSLLDPIAGQEDDPAAGAEPGVVRRWRILMRTLAKRSP